MDILDLFIRRLASKRGSASKNTIKNYLADIRHFINWYEKSLKTNFEANLVTSDVILLYEKSMGSIINGDDKINQGLGVVSMKRHISSLRKFFYVLKDEGIIANNPFESIKPAIDTTPTDYWHIKSFKDQLLSEKASKITIKSYISDIIGFAKWYEQAILPTLPNALTSTGGFYLITQNIIDEYKERLIEVQNAAPRTVNRKLSALRKYLDFASRKGFIGIDEISIDPYRVIPESNLESTSTVKLSEVKPIDEIKLKYSPIPPIRLLQKLVIFPYLSIEDKAASIIASIIAGKPVEGLQKLPTNVASEILKKNDLRSKKINISSILGVNNVQKSFYQPEQVSLLGQPLYKKLIHHAKHTRPSWYHKYHNYAFVHYAHFALLVIFASGVGVALYNNLVLQKQKQASAAPTAPPRVLSFQGRLTDNLDNPITTPTDIRFLIYNDPTSSGSALLWQEVHYLIAPDQDGIFAVILGDTTTIPSTVFTDNSSLYLGVSIKTTSELTPRQRIASVGYATNAEFLQGLPPTTQAGITSFSNVVLALDSSGNLTLSDSSPTNHTFQVSNGTFRLSGQPLLLSTNSGTDGNVVISPDGLGKIDIQKGITNSTSMGNIAPGAVEINDKFAILATESAVAAFVINNNTTGGDILTASSSGTARFTIQNDGTLVSGLYTGQNGVLYGSQTTGIIAQTTTSFSGLCLQSGISNPTWGACGGAQYWGLSNGAISPIFPSVDVLFGGSSTTSAKFRFINNLTGTPIASISANSGNNATFISGDGNIGATNRQNLTLGNSSLYNSTGNLLLNPNGVGRIGIFTSNPLASFDLRGISGTQVTASISANTSAPALLIDNSGTGDFLAASKGGQIYFRMNANSGSWGGTPYDGELVVGKNGLGKITAAVVDPEIVGNQNTTGTQSLTFQTMGSSNADFIYKNISTELSRLTQAGQFQLPITGSTGGIVLGGDAQIFRGAANRLDLASGDSFNVVSGNIQVAGSTVIDSSANATFNSLIVTGGCTGCGASGANSPFQALNGAIVPINSTLDFILGSQASSSAKFAVLNISNGTPTASISSGLSGGSYVDANGNFATLDKQSLTLGSTTTGNILIGTDNTSRAVTIGNSTGSTVVGITSGTGGLSLASTSTGNITISSTNQLLIDSTNALEINSSASPISIGNDAVNQNINIGTGGSRSIVIGNTTPDTSISLTSGGSGQITLDSDTNLYLDADGFLELNSSAGPISIGNDSDAQNINIGNGSSQRLITIGNITGATAIELALGTGGINIGDGTPTKTIDIGGNDSNAQDTVRIATNSTSADTISIGNSNGSTTLSLTGGSSWSINTSGTISSASTTGISLSGSDADLVFSGSSNHDISASSGTLRLGPFTLLGDITGGSNNITGLNNLTAAGTITFSSLNGQNAVLYGTQTTGVLAQATTSTSGLCLVSSGSAPSWGSCTTSTNSPFETLNGVITQKNTTLDFLLGGISTSSAKFAVLNLNGTGPATATVSGNLIVMPNNGAGGFVGIGTTNPGDKLALAGGNFTQTALGNPGLKGTYNTSGAARGLQVVGKYAYVADDTSGLQIIDVTNPSSPTLIGTYNTSGSAFGVAVSGKYAYVADGSAGLQIIDIQNPNAPFLVNTVDTPSGARNVYIVNKYAYVADDFSGIQVIDISKPASARIVGSYDTPGEAMGLYIYGNYIYVADLASGVEILDISNPTNPTLVGSYAVNGARNIYVSGRYAYIAAANVGLRIIDISNPTSPSTVGTYNTSDDSFGVSVAGNYAYVADNSSGLNVINVSDPTTPTLVGIYDTPDLALYVQTVGKYAYVADFSSGLQIVDINGLISPSAYIGTIATNTLSVSENFTLGNNLYVGNGIDIGNGGIYSTGGFSFVSASGAASLIEGAPIGNSLLTVNQLGGQDIFTASSSGTTRFTISSVGSITASSFTTNGGVLFTNGSGLFSQTGAGSASQCLLGGTTPTWGTCVTNPSPFQTLSGAIAPINSTLDTLLGGQASTSATFKVTGKGNPFAGTQVAASISANTSAPALLIDNSGTGDFLAASKGGQIYFSMNARSGNYAGNDYDGELKVGKGGNGKLTALVVDPVIVSNQKTSGTQSLTLHTSGATNADFLFINQSTTLSTLTQAGQFQLPITGSTGGIVLGGDTQIFRGAANRLDLSSGDSLNLVSGALQIGGSTIIDSSGNGTFNTLNVTGGCTGCTTYTNSPFQTLNGAIVPLITTTDFLVGSQSTSSAKFAVLNINGNQTPVASVSATQNNTAIYISGDGSLQSVRKNTLTVGGSTTGNIQFRPGDSASSLFLGSNGNVGIGTTNPLVTLAVNSPNSDVSLQLKGSNGIANGANYIQFLNNAEQIIGRVGDTEDNETAFRVNAVQNDKLLLGGSDKDYVEIQNGILGIGTINTGSLPVSSYAQGTLHVTRQLSSLAATGKALAIFDQTENQDIFSASASGTSKFAINNNGSIKIAASSGIDALTSGSISLGNGSTTTSVTVGRTSAGITLPGFDCSAQTNGGKLTTTSGGVLTCSSDTGTNDVSKWILSTSQGTLSPINNTVDFLIGGSSTSSAKFAVLNLAGTGPAVATISGNLIVMPNNGTGGNVGIGTTTPGDKLALAGGNFTQTASGNPGLKGTLDTSGSSEAVYVVGKYAYVADGNTGGLVIVDVSNPSSPVQVGSLATSGARGIHVVGKYVYLAANTADFKIIDVSNPLAPRLMSTLTVTTDVQDVYVSGKYAYLANNTPLLQIVDISNPSLPVLTGSVATTGIPVGVYVSGKYAFVADNTSGLQIVDISNPAFPAIVGTVDTGTATDVYVSGRYAYVSDTVSGIQVVDLKDINHPAIVGTLALSGSPQDIYTAGDYAYVAVGSAGLSVVNISNPTSPSLVGTYDTSGNANGIFLSGKYAYIADGSSGLQIIDINGINTPSLFAGSLKADLLSVSDNGIFGNNLYVENALNVGIGGILSDGALSIRTASGAANLIEGAPTGKALLTLNQIGSQDILAASTSGTTMFVIGNTGNISGAGILQVGSTTNTTYSRLGTGTTSHSLSGAGSLLVSGNLEVDGSIYLDGTVATGLTASRFVTTDGSGNLATTQNSTALSNTLSDETGTGGVAVFNSSPTIATSIIASSLSFDVFNTTATTVNAFGAATTLELGATTGTTSVNNALSVDGNTTLGNSNTADTLTGNLLTSTITSGATSQTALSLTASSLTSGQVLNITGNSGSGNTNANGFTNISSDIGSGGSLLYLAPDFNSGAGTDTFGARLVGTNSTTTGENSYGYSSEITVTGAMSSGTRNLYGFYSNPATTSVNTNTSTNNLYGGYFIPSSTNTSTGTVNVYGIYTGGTGTLTSTGTINHYGVYVANPSSSTTGTSRLYGIYLEPQSGADTNVGLCFDCDGTWSSSTVASGIQFGSDANLVNLYRNGSDLLTTDDALSVGGVLQVGSATSTTYSRFGTGTTTHSLSGANSLLISNNFEVDGNAFFDGNITIAGTCTGCGGGGGFDVNSNGTTTQKNTTTDLLIGGVATTSAKFIVQANGNVGIGLSDAPNGKSRNPISKLDIYSSLGTVPAASISANTTGPVLQLTQNGSGDLLVASKSGATFLRFSLGSGNSFGQDYAGAFEFGLNGTGKMSFGVQDPPYTIDGTMFATYAPSVIGLYEEFLGKAVLSYNPQLKSYAYVLDFNNFDYHSDLWVFNRIIDPDVTGINVAMTPNSNARTWYKKDGANRKIVLFSDRPTEISYRLSGKRFDATNYPTLRTSGPLGYVPPPPTTSGSDENNNDIDSDPYFNLLTVSYENGKWKLKDADNNELSHTEAFSKAIIANVKSGLVEAQKITTGDFSAVTAFINTLSGNTLSFVSGSFNTLSSSVSNIGNATASSLAVTTGNITIAGQSLNSYIQNVVNNYLAGQIISPIGEINNVKTNVVSPLADSSAPSLTLENSKVNIKNDTQTVSWFDKNGDASFSGQLTANSVNTNNATVSGTLAAGNIQTADASVSGTLRTGNLIADNIEGLDNKIATLASVLNGNYQPQATGSGQFSNLFAGIVNATTITADFGIFEQGITSMGPITASDITAIDSLAVGTNFTISNNAINTIGAELALQSLRQADITFQGGLIRMDTDGNMSIAGNLNLLGEIDAAHGVFASTLTSPALATSMISPLAGDDLTIRLNDKQASEGSRLRIVNNQNKEVLAVDNKGNLTSSGSATLSKLNFNLVGQAEATSLTEAVATGSAGFATLKAHQPEITIKNPNVTSKSLIYITPFGDTDNKVLYLLRQIPQSDDADGSFTVGLSGSTSTQNIQFNWLIIN